MLLFAWSYVHICGFHWCVWFSRIFFPILWLLSPVDIFFVLFTFLLNKKTWISFPYRVNTCAHIIYVFRDISLMALLVFSYLSSIFAVFHCFLCFIPFEDLFYFHVLKNHCCCSLLNSLAPSLPFSIIQLCNITLVATIYMLVGFW